MCKSVSISANQSIVDIVIGFTIEKVIIDEWLFVHCIVTLWQFIAEITVPESVVNRFLIRYL